MARAYKTVMRGSGTAAAIVGAAWVVAQLMSNSDGAGGTELPKQLNAACMILIISCSTLGGGAWLVERSHRIAAEEHIRPLVRHELDRAFADVMPLIVATVVESVERRGKAATERFGERVDGQLQDVATQAARQTAAIIRQAHTEDLSEICNDLHRKTLIAGQIMQANATGEAIGKTALRSVKQYVSTSRED